MGTLRIVAGRLKGRRILVPPERAIRPTSDRVREALFNILGQDLSGLEALDLYAGTGALGFEALSRGARKVVFIEADARTAAALRNCARDLGVEHETRVIVARVEDVLARQRIGGPYDVVFADPPYAAETDVPLAQRIEDGGVLSPDGVLVVERESTSAASAGAGAIRLARTVKYGRTAVDFFKYS